jgi:tetratricopeptide (TPR) repeat protein
MIILALHVQNRSRLALDGIVRAIESLEEFGITDASCSKNRDSGLTFFSFIGVLLMSFRSLSHDRFTTSFCRVGKILTLTALFYGGSVSSLYSEQISEKPNVLIKKAWEANKSKAHKEAIQLADRCIELYKDVAQRQQNQLTDFPTAETTHKYFILNTVGQCLNVKSKSLLALGETEKAKESLEKLIKDYHFAQHGGKEDRKALVDVAKGRLAKMKDML